MAWDMRILLRLSLTWPPLSRKGLGTTDLDEDMTDILSSIQMDRQKN